MLRWGVCQGSGRTPMELLCNLPMRQTVCTRGHEQQLAMIHRPFNGRRSACAELLRSCSGGLVSFGV